MAVPARVGRIRRRLQGPHPARRCAPNSTIAKQEGLLVPAAAWGYFAVNSEGESLVVWKDDTRTQEWLRFHYPRQRKAPFLSIADFFRPVESGETDYAAFHVVTMGTAASAREKELFAADKYQDYLLLHGLSVEMTEALAELWHRRIREEWGFADEDGPTLTGLFKQQYRGSRYSWGYPACPDLDDQTKVAELLGDRAHRRVAHRGVPPRPRAVDERDHRPPPRGEILRRVTCPANRWQGNRLHKAETLPSDGRVQGRRTARATRSVPNAVRIARYRRPVAAMTAE